MKEEQPGREPTEVQKLLKGMLMGLGILFIVGLIFVNIQECNRSNSAPKTPPSTESIQNARLKQEVASLKHSIMNRKARIDTIKIRIPYAVKSADQYYNDKADSCPLFMSHYKRLRDITDSLLFRQTLSQDSTINHLTVVVAKQDSVIRNDSAMLVKVYGVLVDTVKYKDKQIRRRGFKRLMQGIGIGAAIGVGLGSQIKN